MPSLFTELRRRNVFKVGAAYAIVAWLLLQITDIVLPTFQAPLWVAQTITFVLAIGFPIAVILAWAFDVTPQGIKAASDVKVGDAPAQPSALRLGYISQGLILLAVGFLVVDQYVLEPGVSAIDASSSDATSSTPSNSSAQLSRLTINLGETELLGATGVSAQVAVSPDGSSFVYGANLVDEGFQLYLRSLDQFAAQLISGTEEARGPFFSHDGEWLGFAGGMGMGMGVIMKMSMSGGAAQTVTDTATRLFGASWSTNNTIVYGSTQGTNINGGYLALVSATGGLSEALTTPESGTSHRFPQFLPSGNTIIFTITDDRGRARIAVLSLESREYRTLIEDGYNARYAPTGHIVFMRENTLWAVPFDLERLEIAGNQTPVEEGVQADASQGRAAYAFSDNGLLVYVRDDGSSLYPTDATSLVWVDPEGEEELFDAEPGNYWGARLSPDGRRIAYAQPDSDGGADIWIYDIARAIPTRLTFNDGFDFDPIWTPDGQRVAFWSDRDGSGIFWRAADGTGTEDRLTTVTATGTERHRPTSFVPDATQLLFNTYGRSLGDRRDVYVVSIEGGNTPQVLLGEEYLEEDAVVSPDGRWIAYTSDESGESEIYVRSFLDTEAPKLRISRDGGEVPRWGDQGREILYRAPGATPRMIAVAVETEPTVSPGNMRPLFGDRYNGGVYDISSDGRFLMRIFSRLVDAQRQDTSLAVVQNWYEELNRLAPPSP